MLGILMIVGRQNSLVYRSNTAIMKVKGRDMPENNTGKFKKYFQDTFAGFDSGKSVLSWNWFAAIFQLIWYLFKGMWPKVFLYGVILWALPKIALEFEIFSFEAILWILAFLYFGAMANYDYYLCKVKGELLWPKMPYKKLKVLFWIFIIVTMAYAGTAAVFNSIIAEPEKLVTFESDGVKFTCTSGQWSVHKDPPHLSTVKVPGFSEGGLSDFLVYKAFRGTKFLGYILEDAGKEKIYKGLVAFIEYKPAFGKRFTSLQDRSVVDRAKMLTGAGKMPKFMGGWITTGSQEAKYLDFAGQRWGLIENDIGINFGSENKMKLCLAAYWTIVNGKAIFVVTESLDKYKDDVRAQVEAFLNSFGKS